jgi:hypothetical protein
MALGNTSMMLGKSEGPRVCVAGPSLVGVIARWILPVALLAACANNVPQDKQTGPDGKIKGAKELVLENGEAKAMGVVTYPGGDRVDWKLLQLPEKKRGTLDIKLSWTPPRPSLQLAFDVFDEWNELLVSSSKKTGKKKARGRTREATLDNARGKYFIRVYAVGRGDAGKYKLTVEFKEQLVGPAFDPLKLEIPDPPKLAAVPDYVEPCGDDNFDPKKAECKNFCPASGAPPNWGPCKGKCPDPPTLEVEACWKTMPCPRPPDSRVRACTPDKFPACPDKKNPDPNNPNCLVPADPIVGRVVGREVEGGEIALRIGAGSDQGITKAWRAMIISGPDLKDRPVPGGEVQIISVDKTRIRGKTKLTAGQVDANPYVKFVPAK